MKKMSYVPVREQDDTDGVIWTRTSHWHRLANAPAGADFEEARAVPVVLVDITVGPSAVFRNLVGALNKGKVNVLLQSEKMDTMMAAWPVELTVEFCEVMIAVVPKSCTLPVDGMVKLKGVTTSNL